MDGKTPLDRTLGDGNAAGRFPWGWGVAGLGGLRPAAWRDSVARAGDERGAASARAAFLTFQRPSIVDWATEMREGVSRGVGGWRGWAGCAQPRGAILRRWAAMRTLHRQPRPPCGRENAPQLENGRRKRGRTFPVVAGVAGMAGYAQPRGAILRRCALHSIGTGRLVDGIAPLDWRSGNRKLVGRF